jgi:hypothetical protein
MTMERVDFRTGSAILLTVIAGSPSAAEPSGAQLSLGLGGHVALICQARFEPPQLTQGQLVESCNDPKGYEVHAVYSPELANGAIFVDGQRLELDSSGSLVVVRSAIPRRTSHLVKLELPRGGEQGTISFRIVPASRRI